MANKIDIDPNTGAPIVVLADKNESKETVSDFVAQVMESRAGELASEQPDEIQKIPAELPDPQIPPTGPGNPAPQHAHLIKSAKEFNENLNRPPASTPPALYGIPYPIQMTIGVEAQIRSVLKDGGMDTQQQDKSMARIAEILSVAKQSVSQ